MPPSKLEGGAIPRFRRALLRWYDARRRDLPWRRTRDPYGIWLSEVMLQQTTVQTVIPRWEKFLRRWPTLADLAAAPLDDVLHEWTGLGYYARARNLHKAAQAMVAQFGGEVPGNYGLLLALPGMGVYTAAAVASIAFGEPVAVLDANVERVLARLDAMEDEVRRAPVKTRLRERAAELLSPGRPGDFNQAMMELGATVCQPRAPRCGECPAAGFCLAQASGDPASYPRLPEKTPMEEVREAAIILRHGGRILVLRRPAVGSFAGMWELPRVKCRPDEPGDEAARRAARDLAGLIPGRIGAPILRLRHTVMRSRITLLVHQSTAPGRAANPTEHEEYRWVTPGEWQALPKSTTQDRVARFLAEGRLPERRKSRILKDPAQGDLFDP